jgi:hypothetical protein
MFSSKPCIIDIGDRISKDQTEDRQMRFQTVLQYINTIRTYITALNIKLTSQELDNFNKNISCYNNSLDILYKVMGDSKLLECAHQQMYTTVSKMPSPYKWLELENNISTILQYLVNPENFFKDRRNFLSETSLHRDINKITQNFNIENLKQNPAYCRQVFKEVLSQGNNRAYGLVFNNKDLSIFPFIKQYLQYGSFYKQTFNFVPKQSYEIVDFANQMPKFIKDWRTNLDLYTGCLHQLALIYRTISLRCNTSEWNLNLNNLLNTRIINLDQTVESFLKKINLDVLQSFKVGELGQKIFCFLKSKLLKDDLELHKFVLSKFFYEYHYVPRHEVHKPFEECALISFQNIRFKAYNTGGLVNNVLILEMPQANRAFWFYCYSIAERVFGKISQLELDQRLMESKDFKIKSLSIANRQLLKEIAINKLEPTFHKFHGNVIKNISNFEEADIPIVTQRVTFFKKFVMKSEFGATTTLHTTDLSAYMGSILLFRLPFGNLHNYNYLDLDDTYLNSIKIDNIKIVSILKKNMLMEYLKTDFTPRFREDEILDLLEDAWTGQKQNVKDSYKIKNIDKLFNLEITGRMFERKPLKRNQRQGQEYRDIFRQEVPISLDMSKIKLGGIDLLSTPSEIDDEKSVMNLLASFDEGNFPLGLTEVDLSVIEKKMVPEFSQIDVIPNNDKNKIEEMNQAVNVETTTLVTRTPDVVKKTDNGGTKQPLLSLNTSMFSLDIGDKVNKNKDQPPINLGAKQISIDLQEQAKTKEKVVEDVPISLSTGISLNFDSMGSSFFNAPLTPEEEERKKIRDENNRKRREEQQKKKSMGITPETKKLATDSKPEGITISDISLAGSFNFSNFSSSGTKKKTEKSEENKPILPNIGEKKQKEEKDQSEPLGISLNFGNFDINMSSSAPNIVLEEPDLGDETEEKYPIPKSAENLELKETPILETNAITGAQFSQESLLSLFKFKPSNIVVETVPDHEVPGIEMKLDFNIGLGSETKELDKFELKLEEERIKFHDMAIEMANTQDQGNASIEMEREWLILQNLPEEEKGELFNAVPQFEVEMAESSSSSDSDSDNVTNLEYHQLVPSNELFEGTYKFEKRAREAMLPLCDYLIQSWASADMFNILRNQSDLGNYIKLISNVVSHHKQLKLTRKESIILKMSLLKLKENLSDSNEYFAFSLRKTIRMVRNEISFFAVKAFEDRDTALEVSSSSPELRYASNIENINLRSQVYWVTAPLTQEDLETFVNERETCEFSRRTPFMCLLENLLPKLDIIKGDLRSKYAF